MSSAVKLTTVLPDRSEINIDGVDYELMRNDDFSLEDRRTLNKKWKAFTAIEEKVTKDEVITEDEQALHDRLLFELACMLLPGAPTEKVLGVRYGGWEAIVTSFFLKELPKSGRLNAIMDALMEAQKTTGSTSSPGSNSSMEAIPNAG